MASAAGKIGLSDTGTARTAAHTAQRFSCAPWAEAIVSYPLGEWSALAENAGDPNPFFELWQLHPALEQFDPQGSISFAMLQSRGRLSGFLPIKRSNTYYGRPIPHLRGWLHDNAFCGQPLVAKGHEREFWAGLLDWADRNARTELFLHLCHMPEDSPLVGALRDICVQQSRPAAIVLREERALLQSTLDPDAYLADAMSGKKRKELRRQYTRLAELGDVRVCRNEGPDGVERWTDAFLRLEAAGWKGTNGSALAADPRTETYFRDTLQGAAQAGKLERLSLELDGQPIAMLATLLARPGAFAFKTAFDEDYARFSPGMLLQRENLALLEREDIDWCDSCAAADHPMIERIWRQKRTMLHINVAIGGTLRRTIGAQLLRIEGRQNLSEIAV